MTDFGSGDYRVVGGVDTGAALILGGIRKRFPDLRVYSLTRADARESCERLGLIWTEWESLDVPVFEYEKLFDVGYLEEVWTELNGPGFDPVRASQLIEFNVQRDIGRLVDLCREKIHAVG